MIGKTLKPGTIISGRYRVLREIGRGAMGVVFVVEHVNTGGQLALKVMIDSYFLDPNCAARFRREARASARIASEHVVRVTDADSAPELDGAPFLVMELLDGADLEQTLRSGGAFPPDEALKILLQVARALDKAHAAGVIHRDLKPENVFLHRREDGTSVVKVLDFGISKILDADLGASGAGSTSPNTIMGTPLYMAPEQAMGRNDQVGPSTDVWAVGLLTYTLLTAAVYWRAESIAEMLVQILVPQREPPSTRFASLPAGFDAWFARSTAQAPAERFQSVGEQISALSVIITGQPARQFSSSAPSLERLPEVNVGALVESGKHVATIARVAPGAGATQPLYPSAMADSSSARQAVGVSTEVPVSRTPTRTARSRSMAFAGVAIVMCGVGGTSIALALRDKEVAAKAGASAESPASPAGSAATLPSAAAPSASAPLPASVSSYLPLLALSSAQPPAASAPAASVAAPARVAQRSGGEASAPAPAVLLASSSPPAPPAPPAPPSTMAPAAPPAPTKPQDLFDTQR